MREKRPLESKLREGAEVEELKGSTVPTDITPKARSMLKGEAAELEQEENLPDSLNYSETLAIIVERARSWRQRRDDPDVRAKPTQK